MIRRACVAASALLLLGLVARPAWTDIPPAPRVEVYFDDLEKFPDYAFFLFPADGDRSGETGGFERVSAGKPFRFDKYKADVPPAARLYALKGRLPQKRNDPLFSDPTLPRSHLDLRFLALFREGGAQTYHYRVTAIEAGVIKLELVSKGFSPEAYHRAAPPFH